MSTRRKPSVRLALQGEAQALEHEPGGLLGHVKVPCQFVATDTVLAISEQPQRGEPLIESDCGILEDGSDLERELRLGVLLVALPAALVRQVSNLSDPQRGQAMMPSGHRIASMALRQFL